MRRELHRLRWALPLGLSLLAHLLFVGAAVAAWPAQTVLPRLHLDVVGVTMAPERTGGEGAPAPADEEAPEVEPEPDVEPEPRADADGQEPTRGPDGDRPAPATEPGVRLALAPEADREHDREQVRVSEDAREEERRERAPEEELDEEPQEQAPEEEHEEERREQAPEEERQRGREQDQEQDREQVRDLEDLGPDLLAATGRRPAAQPRVAGPPPPELIELPEELTEGNRLAEVLADGSRVAVYMRTAEFRTSPNAREARQLMRAIAGYDLYLGDAAFDPITDFEWMLVRSPDLTVRTRTRLRARLDVDMDRARATVERIPPRGEAVRWNGTPGAPQIGALPRAEGAWREVGWALLPGERPGYLAGPRRWVRRLVAEPNADDAMLESLASVRIEGEPADLTVVTTGLGTLLGEAGAPGSEAETLVLSARLDEAPTIVARLWFPSSDEALRFARFVQHGLGQLADDAVARLFDLEALVRRVELHHSGQTVTAWIRLEPRRATRLLGIVTALVRQRGSGDVPLR